MCVAPELTKSYLSNEVENLMKTIDFDDGISQLIPLSKDYNYTFKEI